MYLLVLQDSASEPAGLGGVCRQDSSSQLFSAGPACFPRQSLYFGVFSLEDLIISQKGSPRGNASVSHGCLPSFTAGKGSGSPWQRQGGRPAGPSGPVLSFPNCRGCWLLTAYGWVPLQELPSAKGYTLSSGILSIKINLCSAQGFNIFTSAGSTLQSLPHSRAPVGPAEAPAATTSHLTFARCSSSLPKLVCKAFSQWPQVQSLASVSASSASASASEARADITRKRSVLATPDFFTPQWALVFTFV